MTSEDLSFIHALVYAQDGALLDDLMHNSFKTYRNLEEYVNPLAAKCKDSKLHLYEDELLKNVKSSLPRPIFHRMITSTINFFNRNARRRLPTANPYDHEHLQLSSQFFDLVISYEKERFGEQYRFNKQITSLHKFDIGVGEYFIPNIHAKQFKYVVLRKLSIKSGYPRRWEARFLSSDPGYIIDFVSSNEG